MNKVEEGLIFDRNFGKFKEWVHDAKRVLISTHLLPDGDGLGAETALFHYLKRARKACRIYNPDLLPKRYRFLDPKGQILLGPGEVELWDTCDLWVIVDTNDPRRLGKLWGELSLRAKKIVFLDHHPETSKGVDFNDRRTRFASRIRARAVSVTAVPSL